MVHRRFDDLHLLVLAIDRDVGRKTGATILRVYVLETVVGNLLSWPKMPFAKLRCDVAGLLKSLGDRLFVVEAVK